MNSILDSLKKFGEQSDIELAASTGLPLTEIRLYLSELQSKNEVMLCHAIRFENDTKIEVTICRLVGHGPVIKTGKKAKPQFVA